MFPTSSEYLQVKDLSGTGNAQLMFYTMAQEKEVYFLFIKVVLSFSLWGLSMHGKYVTIFFHVEYRTNHTLHHVDFLALMVIPISPVK